MDNEKGDSYAQSDLEEGDKINHKEKHSYMTA